MHNVPIRQEIMERVLARRGRYHLFENLVPAQTALVVIDMQPTFLAPGAPAEVPVAREIVPNINRLAAALRAAGGTVIWITHANESDERGSDWEGFFQNFVAEDLRERTRDSLKPGGNGQKLWAECDRHENDISMHKNRYSALIPGASMLERVVRSRGIDTLLIAGTKTNVCCESTARDAMMLDFKVIMVSDATAALSDDEHRAALENIIQQFGDVLTTDETIAKLAAGGATAP